MASEEESQQVPIDLQRRVVDFSAFHIDKADHQLDRHLIDRVARQLWDGFASDGFVYLENHGITNAEIARIFAASDSFFGLPVEVKNQYRLKDADDNQGYVPIDGERLANGKQWVEHRECFHVTSTKGILPETECRGISATVDQFYSRCTLLALRVLKAIAIALKLEDDYFTKIHLPMDTPTSYSSLRLLNYPLVTPEEAHKSIVRCGEHSDYGSLTLLFQDEAGGLEAKVRSGEYVHIMPIPGTVLVNIADILEHMTSGQLLSVKHRVLLKTDSHTKRRRSVAFFVTPINEALVQRLNGPPDPHPHNCKDFLKSKYEANYI